MQRMAMKSLSYLPDFPFTTQRNNEQVTVTKEQTYDDFDVEQYCWIGLDLSGVTRMVVEIVQEEINRVIDQTQPGHLFINRTHPHSGPNFTLHPKFNQQGPERREEIAPIVFHIGKKAAELVQACKKELVPFTSEIKVNPDRRRAVCYINDRVSYLAERKEYGKNFESLSSIIPMGMPKVLTEMMIKELDQFDLMEREKQ